MKRIYFIRHAEANQYSPIGGDKTRELNKEGHSEASNLALYFKENLIKPEYLEFSSATRTKQTAEYLIKTLDIAHYSQEDILYNCFVDQLLDRIQALDNDFKTVAFVFHNPAVSEVLVEISNKFASVKTSGFFYAEYNGNWWDVHQLKQLNYIDGKY